MPIATKFFIAGTQRTGTTFIRTSIGSHPDILCQGEVFLLGKKPYKDEGGYWQYSRRNFGNRIQALIAPSVSTANYLEELYSRSGYAAIGFKLMLSHCLARPYIWSRLMEQDVRAILVRRRNLLKTFVSRRAAAQSGVYHISEALQKSTSVRSWVASKINIDIATLIHDLRSIELEYTSWKSRIDGNIDHIEIDYEQYVEDRDTTSDLVLNFLGVQRLSLESDLKKVNPDNLQELIENYADVIRVLEHTEYAEYLDQP